MTSRNDGPMASYRQPCPTYIPLSASASSSPAACTAPGGHRYPELRRVRCSGAPGGGPALYDPGRTSLSLGQAQRDSSFPGGGGGVPGGSSQGIFLSYRREDTM